MSHHDPEGEGTIEGQYAALARAIESEKDELATLIVDEQWRRNPGFQARYGDVGHAKCVQDVRYNLSYLSQAIASDSLPLFTTYTGWVKTLFEHLRIPTGELIESLEITGDLLSRRYSEGTGSSVTRFIEAGLQQLRQSPQTMQSYLEGPEPLSALARQYLEILRNGERADASRLVLDAVEQGTSIKDIYLHVFQPCQYEIGRLWHLNEMSVAEEHYCTAATQMIMAQLYEKIFTAGKKGRSMVATCVGNELHQIGMHMVADFLEMEGWHTHYLGANTPTPSVLWVVRTRQPDLLAISATMTFHVRLVQDLIEQVRAIDTGKRPRILVGGYPFNIERELWRRVGADGYAPDAGQAVVVANRLVPSRDQG